MATIKLFIQWVVLAELPSQRSQDGESIATRLHHSLPQSLTPVPITAPLQSGDWHTARRSGEEEEEEEEGREGTRQDSLGRRRAEKEQDKMVWEEEEEEEEG